MGGTKYTPEDRNAKIQLVLDNIEEGMPEYAAARASGISYPTWYRWKEETPGLYERMEKAKLFRVPLWEDSLHKQAMKGSVSACLALLERYDQRWRQRAKDLPSQAPTFIFNGNAAIMIKMLEPEKRQKLLLSMIGNGLLPESVKEIGANGSASPE